MLKLLIGEPDSTTEPNNVSLLSSKLSPPPGMFFACLFSWLLSSWLLFSFDELRNTFPCLFPFPVDCLFPVPVGGLFPVDCSTNRLVVVAEGGVAVWISGSFSINFSKMLLANGFDGLAPSPEPAPSSMLEFSVMSPSGDNPIKLLANPFIFSLVKNQLSLYIDRVPYFSYTNKTTF